MHDLDQYSPPDAYYHDPDDDRPEVEPDLGFFQDKVATYLKNEGHHALADTWLQYAEQDVLYMARLHHWHPSKVTAALIRLKGRGHMKGMLVYNIKWDITPVDFAELENEWTTVNDRVHWGLYEVTQLPSAVWLDLGDPATFIEEHDDPNQYICDILSDSHGWTVADYSVRYVNAEGEEE